jgi:hypothetical protein
MSHTPGPWSACLLESCVTAPDGDVAEVLTLNDYDIHLIAAAPDLLAALEYLSDKVQLAGIDDDHERACVGQAMEQARTAVKKARGE